MITPFFAPYSHAAVYRAHRFAKYLPRFGWGVKVLTVDKSLLYFIDKALLDDLPEEVEIVRARHIDLTYSALKAVFKKTPKDSRLIEEPPKNLLKRVMDRFRHELLFLPDRYITWYPFALKKAKEIIKTKSINVIYSTALPFTPHLMAWKLKEQFGMPWIADFRDPGVEFKHGMAQRSRLRYKIDSLIEKKVMRKADLILTLSEDVKSFFLNKYKDMVAGKIVTIRTGTDLEILESAESKEKSEKFSIIFIGEFLREYNKNFFKFLNVIFERDLFKREDIEVLIIGHLKRNIYLKKEIESLGLADVVKLVDYLSLKDYFSVLSSADATLLPSVLRCTFPIKLTDYLFVKKPIIIFEATDEVRDILEKSGLGFFIPGDIERGIDALLDLLMGRRRFKANEDYIKRFSAFNQTKELSYILQNLHSGRR